MGRRPRASGERLRSYSDAIAAGLNVNAPNEKTGLTPLMLAAGNGHKKVCQMLLKAKAKKNLRSTGGRL